jgi:CRP/FNR family transcriptional regulator
MSDSTVRAETIQSINVFQDLSHEELTKVASVLKHKKYTQGSQLIVQDQKASEVFFIVNGRVRVEMARLDGKTHETLTMLSGGDAVGELALARVGRRTASVVAQMDSEICSGDAGEINKLFEANPTIGLKVFRSLSRILAQRLGDTNIMLRNTTI